MERLLSWYQKNKRDLPWRKTKDPYAILVSEVMLQQTQVRTVVPYYHRWMARFPNLQALARAPWNAVLKSWEGLGYYRRAKLLHEAAKLIVVRHKGIFPKTVPEISEFPGVGPYTLAAVASIAFGISLPVLDGNVIRVLARFHGFREPTQGALAQKKLRLLAEGSMSHENPGDFNQAMMELGATVCLPRKPLCLLCPIRNDCWAYQNGAQDKLPLPVTRLETVPEFEYAVLVLHREQVLLHQRPEGSRMAGLWEFPSVMYRRPLRRWSEPWERHFGSVSKLEKLDESEYFVTHHKIRLQFFRAHGFRARKGMDAEWVNLAKAPDLPFTAAHRKLADQFLIEKKVGKDL